MTRPSPPGKTPIALGDTKHRLLEAMAVLFIEHGYEALLLRQITERAEANLAAVNYHFGGKEGLMRALLAQQLEPLNERRLQLLAACQQHAGGPLSCEAVLGVLFAPTLELEQSGPPGAERFSFVRFLSRVYSDTSPFIQAYLQEHYRPVFDRFFEAFATALPALPRSELGLRLRLALRAISGVMAGTELGQLRETASLGRPSSDTELMARLIGLVAAAITAPLGHAHSLEALRQVLRVQHETFATRADLAEACSG